MTKPTAFILLFLDKKEKIDEIETKSIAFVL